LDEDLIQDAIRPAVEAVGLDLWGLEIESPGRRKILRLYVDKPGGASVGDCAEASRQAGAALEVEDVVPGPYTLEVSTPGLERRFFSLEQMAPYAGREVKVQLKEPLEGRKNFRGLLQTVAGGSFTLVVDQEPVELEWPNVKRARLVHDFDGGG
jgi:ribosome maturation factor RimP